MKKTDEEMLALVRDEAHAFADFAYQMQRFSAGAKSDDRMRHAMERHHKLASEIRCAGLMRIGAHDLCVPCAEAEAAA